MSAVSDSRREPRGDVIVRFRVRDVHVPLPDDLLVELYGDRILEGRVVGRSRDAPGDEGVVVRVEGLDLLVVVDTRGLV